MPLTHQQLAKIRQKDLSTPEALKRNPINDYTEGWFHVTLNVRGEAPVLGFIIGDATAEDASPNTPRCILSELGKRVEEVILSISSFHKNTIVDESIVMPNHLHLLLHLLPGNKEHLGKVMSGFMGGCTHVYWDILGIDWRKDHPTQGRSIAQIAQNGAAAPLLPDRDHDHTRSFRGPSLFVRGYNDVEVLDEEEIDIKRQYIRNNPRKHLVQRDRPDLFRVRRHMKSVNWTSERIMNGLCADRYIAADRNKQVEAWSQLTVKGLRNNRGKASATLNYQNNNFVLDLVGNMELLQRPLFPLVCHRADAHLFEQQKATVLKVAREQGGVIVTACVSPKERDIVKLLLQELLPVVEVMDNGFNDRYKPVGKAFYAVAEGRRLEVSPWQYEYRRREMRLMKDYLGNPILDANDYPVMEEVPDITREMCMVMNELVRMIAKKDDDWWKIQ